MIDETLVISELAPTACLNARNPLNPHVLIPKRYRKDGFHRMRETETKEGTAA